MSKVRCLIHAVIAMLLIEKKGVKHQRIWARHWTATKGVHVKCLMKLLNEDSLHLPHIRQVRQLVEVRK